MESVKDLIVDVNPTEVSIALMENNRLIELNKESSQGNSFSVGDVHLGKVKKILPALNAAFVDIGDEKEAFIHYLDLGLYFEAFDEFVKRINPNTDAKGSNTMFRPANEISAVSREPFVEIGSFTIWTMIICPGVSTSSILPSFARI